MPSSPLFDVFEDLNLVITKRGNPDVESLGYLDFIFIEKRMSQTYYSINDCFLEALRL